MFSEKLRMRERAIARWIVKESERGERDMEREREKERERERESSTNRYFY